MVGGQGRLLAFHAGCQQTVSLSVLYFVRTVNLSWWWEEEKNLLVRNVSVSWQLGAFWHNVKICQFMFSIKACINWLHL